MKVFNISIDESSIFNAIKSMSVVERGTFVTPLTTLPPSATIDIATDCRYVDIPKDFVDTIYQQAILNDVHSSAIKYSNCIGYPPKGGMGWHTNSDSAGMRIYASFSENGDSGMVWYKDGRIVVDKDTIGLNIRQFTVPCWHGVWSNCYRFSLGFKII